MEWDGMGWEKGIWGAGGLLDGMGSKGGIGLYDYIWEEEGLGVWNAGGV